jgi:hypothetical protein
VPASSADLRRGAIAYGIFPFAAQFPMHYLDHSTAVATAQTIDDYAQVRRGRPTTVQAQVKLRPLLLLHDGTRGENDDLVGLRINSVKPHHRESSSWPRITAHEHPLFFHLPAGRYGLPEESVIALNSVTSVHKSAVWRVVGSVTLHEMQIVNERLRTVLSLDLAPLIAARARELLKRAGLTPSPAGARH